jgi:hypothetical protein
MTLFILEQSTQTEGMILLGLVSTRWQIKWLLKYNCENDSSGPL